MDRTHTPPRIGAAHQRSGRPVPGSTLRYSGTIDSVVDKILAQSLQGYEVAFGGRLKAPYRDDTTQAAADDGDGKLHALFHVAGNPPDRSNDMTDTTQGKTFAHTDNQDCFLSDPRNPSPTAAAAVSITI